MSSDQGVSSSTNNTNTGFQPVRQNSDNIGQAFENSMQMFAMKQQPMASSITGTIYSGPPAKYLNNNNGYMRPMLPPQKYVTYNGSSMQQQQQRRQNNSGVDNATNDSVNKRKVFVGGLSPDTKMEHLREYFSNFGTVESVTVKYDKSGRSKGFGFVLFEDPDTPNKVYSQDVHIIQGKRVDTKSAHRRDQALARKVFVGGLDPEISDGELQEYFSQFGKVYIILLKISVNVFFFIL
jgi:RNA recognition motif-containing protein